MMMRAFVAMAVTGMLPASCSSSAEQATPEYDDDDELTSLIGNEVTRRNRDSYGSATVSMNPRETAVTAAAFQIPADTRIARLMVVGGGSVHSESSTAWSG